jgi:predicted permease
MLETLGQAFGSSFLAVAEVFVVIVAAGLLVRRGILKPSHIDALSTATVVIFLPCLIFSNVLTNLDPTALTWWWAIPLIAILMTFTGLGLAAVVFVRELPAKRNMLPLASMQNAGYLVLPIGLALAPHQFDEFALYCFLFILGYNPVLWSIGTHLITGSSKRQNPWRPLTTPPFLANVFAIFMVLVGGDTLIPKPVLAGVELMGQAAVPVATLVLGGVLGSVAIRVRSYLWDAIRVIGIKLLVLPVMTATIVLSLELHLTLPVFANFLVIEAAAAPAAGLILQVKSYGGDEHKVGSLMLLSYLACAVSLPLWIAVWHQLVVS